MTNHLLTVGSWSWSVDDDCCFADPVTAALFDIDPAVAAQGVPVRRYLNSIVGNDRRSVEAAIYKSVSTGSRFASEYSVRSAYGVRQVMASGHCFKAPGRSTVFCGHVIDITERVHQSALHEHLGALIDQALNDAARAQLPLLQYVLEMAYLELHGTDQGDIPKRENRNSRRH